MEMRQYERYDSGPIWPTKKVKEARRNRERAARRAGRIRKPDEVAAFKIRTIY